MHHEHDHHEHDHHEHDDHEHDGHDDHEPEKEQGPERVPFRSEQSRGPGSGTRPALSCVWDGRTAVQVVVTHRNIAGGPGRCAARTPSGTAWASPCSMPRRLHLYQSPLRIRPRQAVHLPQVLARAEALGPSLHLRASISVELHDLVAVSRHHGLHGPAPVGGERRKVQRDPREPLRAPPARPCQRTGTPPES